MSNIYSNSYQDPYNNEEKKRPISVSAVVRIVIWSVVFCILSGIFASAMVHQWRNTGLGTGSINLGGYWYDEDDYTVGAGKTLEVVDEITIEWIAGSVTLIEAEGDELVISEDYESEDSDIRLRWKVENGELSVKYCKPSWVGTTSVKKNLTVAVPSSMVASLDEVHVSAVSATQSIQISSDELEIDTVSGDVTVRGTFGTMDVETVSGTVNFEGVLQNGNFEGVSGSLKLKLLQQASSLDMETVSGNMTVTLPETVTGFRVDSDSVSGHVNIHGFDGVSHQRWGDGSMRIDMESVSGQLIVEKATNN